MTSELNNFFLCIRPIFLLTFSPLMLLDVLVTALIALFFRWDTPFLLLFDTYLFFRQCWDMFMCCYFIYDIGISCMYSVFRSDAQQMQMLNILWMANRVFTSSLFLFWRGFPRLFSSKTMFGAGILEHNFFLEYVSPYFYIIVTSRNK